MNEIYQFLSGLVPGGIALLVFIVGTINLLFYSLYKKSRIITKDVYLKNIIQYSAIVFFVYIFLWFYLRPKQLPDKVGVIPFQKESSIDLILCDVLEQQIKNNLSNNYFLHPWEWFYKTADRDSIQFDDYRKKLASKLGYSIIIGGEIRQEDKSIKVDLKIVQDDDIQKNTIVSNSYNNVLKEILKKVYQSTNILRNSKDLYETMSDVELEKLSQAEFAYLEKNYAKVINLLDESTFLYKLQLAKANLKLGIHELPKTPSSSIAFENNNVFFQRVHNLLIPYVKEEKDTPELNLILGQMYLFKKEFGMAEAVLKQALIQNPYDARIYYNLSFLHKDRIKELGFKNRVEILEYTIKLDPGFIDAVYDLAYEYYDSGTATATGRHTLRAQEVLKNFLSINPNEKRILSLLGRIYVQTKYTLEGLATYKKLLSMEPESAETFYNLGICYFHLKDYETAIHSFEKAIELNDHTDSYLYLGALNRLQGDDEKALHYYRERIKRKSGHNDEYAKQAMKGIRLILNDQYEEEQEALKKNEDKSFKSE